VVEDIRSNPLKIVYLVKLLFPVGYLSLLAPQVLLLPAPSVLINVLSASSKMYALDMFHYSAAIVPFVLLSAVWAIETLARWVYRWRRVQRSFIVGVLTVYVLILAGFYYRQLGHAPLGRNYDWVEITEHHRLGEQLARSMPAESALSAQNHLNPHVSQRETLYVFPRVQDAEMIFLDVTGPPGLELGIEEYHAEVQRLIEEEAFGVTLAQEGYIVLQRGAAPASLGPAFYRFARADRVEGAPWVADLGPIQLRGIRYELQPGNVLSVHSYWRATEPCPEDLRLFVCLVDPEGTPLPGTIHETRLSLWYAPQQWNSDELVYDRAALQLPAYEDLDTLSVGLFAGPRSAVEDEEMRAAVTVHDPQQVQGGQGRASLDKGILAVPYD